VFGTVTTQGTLTTATASTIGGDVAALGNVTINDSGTAVGGNLSAGGIGAATANVTMTGCINGAVQASGTITGPAPAGCPTNWVAHSPPVPPPVEALPTFTYNTANYSPAPTNYGTPALFALAFPGIRSTMHGTYHVTCAAPCITSNTLSSAITLTGDTTIVTEAPLTIDAGITNGAAGNVNLTIISTATSTPAITFTKNNTNLSTNIHMLLYANNGSVQFTKVKNFSGAVYAKSIAWDDQFTLTWTPITAPGFAWSAAAGGHSIVVTRDFKEVAFS
jgi:hypothetical protein